jgi:hypothetical protein
MIRSYGRLTVSYAGHAIFAAMAFLTLGLKILLVALAAWMTLIAFKRSVAWGVFFLLAPGVFVVLRELTGGIAAGVLTAVVFLPFVRTHWRQVRGAFVLSVVLIAAIAVITRGTFRGTLP